jgi:signal transduction histidine kinase
MESMPALSAKYARAVRVIAAAIALIAMGKHFTTDFPSATIERQLLILRGIAAAVAIGLAVLSSSRQSMARLRRLAFALGIDVVFVTVGVIIALPAEVWEQSVSLVAMMFVAAVFMPWSWRWQAAYVAIALAAATIALTLVIPRDTLDGRTALRALLTLYAMAALTVEAAHLADGSRRLIEASAADRRTQERREGQEQRLDSMARLSGALAHQYNNILGGILTHAAVLREEVPNPDARAAADEVLKEARRGQELTKELLRLSRPEIVTLRPSSALLLVESAAALARASVPASVDVKIDVPPNLPPITADVDQLVHACLELVYNARDAMRGRPNGRITFTAAEETIATGSYVRISVTDTGRGMEPATVDRMFEPFFTTKPMHEAKGLGLAEVQRVVREHRGSIRIESAIGRGTTVHLLLPVATAAAPASSVPPLPEGERGPGGEGPAPAPASTGATVLIVDDEPIVRNSLKRALTRFGHRVLEAGDGASALAAMQAAQPPVDLVILDLVLPGGGAGIFELLKAVRPDVKVLISSGYSPDGEAARGLATRVEGFLPKPYELTQLREAVTRALA